MGVVKALIQQEEGNLSMTMDFKIDVPCVVQWSLFMVLSATNLHRILGNDLKIEKYHEVVNGAITDAAVHKKRGIKKEMKG